MHATPTRLLLASLAGLLLSCGEEGSSNGEQPTPRPAVLPASRVDCGKGSQSLSGRMLAPNGTTPVVGAFVYVASGNCWVGTDQAGGFTAQGLPSGSTPVRAEKGLFQVEGQAAPGSALTLQADASAVKLAYVPGFFDSIQQVVARLGFTATPLSYAQLGTANLAQYSALLINCGAEEIHEGDTAAVDNLRAYVRNGGVLYTSDFAEEYVRVLFPGKVAFHEPEAHYGAVGPVQARVLDEGLVRALGRSTATVEFAETNWTLVGAAPAGTEVLVRGTVKDVDGATLADRPLVVRFPEGKGRVTFTSFHNEAQVTADMSVLLEQLLFGL